MLSDRKRSKGYWIDTWSEATRFEFDLPEDRITPLPKPFSFVRPTYTFLNSASGGTVSMVFGVGDARSTFFGGDRDTPIVLYEKDVMKLPHDFVHCVLSTEPEGTHPMPNGQTPDIVQDDGKGGYEVLEIKTMQGGGPEQVLGVMNRAMLHYSELIGSQVVTKFNVLVVTPDAVYDLLGRVTALDEGKALVDNCLAAFKFGNMVVRGFLNKYGSKLDPESNAERKKSLLSIKGLKAPEGSVFTDDFGKKVDTSDFGFIIGEESYVTKIETFPEYEIRMRSVAGRAKGKSLIHIPMVVPEQGDIESMPVAKEASVYERIFNRLWATMGAQHTKSYQEIEFESYYRQGEKSEKTNSLDKFKVDVDVVDRINLAMRGVNGKALSGEQEVINNREQSHLPYNWDLDFTQLEDYLITPLLAASTPVDASPVMSNDVCRNKTVPDAKDFFNAALKTKELYALVFLELIAREVAYNAKRHVDSEKESYEFIARRVWGYQAWVVIKTTSYATSNFQYCIFFKGDDLAPGVFEETLQVAGTDWKYTKFVTTDRQKLTHLQGIAPRQISLWGMFCEMRCDVLQEDPLKMMALTRETARHSLIIDLEDHPQLADTLQVLRFYYGELLSGKDTWELEAQKVTDKLPNYTRSAFSQFYIKRMISIHKTLPKNLHVKLSDVVIYVEGEEVDLLNERAEEALKDGILTPFGYQAHTAEDIICAMYFCMLRNKDEGDSGYGGRAILEKLLKGEYEYLKLIGKIDPLEFHIKNEDDPDKIGKYQHNRKAIALAAKMLRAKILAKYGYEENTDQNWQVLVDDLVGKRLSETTIEELMTTKASTVPFSNDMQILLATDKSSMIAQEKQVASVGERNKVIFETLKLIKRGVIKDPVGCNNVEWALEDMRKQGDGLQVTIFRKNQITGQREIYVLTFTGRLLMRAYNDVCRAMCEAVDGEKLTDPKSRDSFPSEHFVNIQIKSKETGYKFCARLRWSGDMTNWANLFSLFDHAGFMCEFYPDDYRGSFLLFNHMIREKKIQLPRSVVESWVRSYSKYVETGELEHVKKIEAEFKGITGVSILRGKQKVVMSILSNMMQGIPHYPSSLYHSAHLEMLKHMVETWCSQQGVVAVFDYEVSSDDEGLLIALMSNDKDKLHKAYKRFIKVWPRLKHTVDKYFGIRTSHKKSTLSVIDFFEFNSDFYIKNTLASALIKFVSRSCDDQPEQSLHKRISSMYSMLRQCRERGASGWLCNLISNCQCFAFYMDLGLGSMSWFDDGLISKVMPDKLTQQGYYAILPPVLAGVVGTEFVNWLSCESSADARKVYTALIDASLPNPQSGEDQEDYAFKLSYGMFPRDRYLTVLRDTGVDIITDGELKTNEVELFFRKLRSIKEVERVGKFRACDSNIARSMAVLTRSDVMNVGSYILWSSICKFNNVKVGLGRLRSLIVNSTKQALPVKGLFPMAASFDYLKKFAEERFRTGKLEGRRRTRYHWFTAHYQSSDHASYAKRVIGSKWFGFNSGLTGRVEKMMWERIRNDLPFLRDRTQSDDPVADTLKQEACPIKTPRQLLGLIESYAAYPNSVKCLSRGGNSPGVNIAEGLSRCNTYLDHDLVMFSVQAKVVNVRDRPVTQNPTSRIFFSMVQDRMKAWTELIYNLGGAPSDRIMRWMTDDFHRHMKDVDNSVWSSELASPLRKYQTEKLFGFFAGRMQFGELTQKVDKLEIYTRLPRWVTDRLEGDHDKFVLLPDGAISCKYVQSTDTWHLETNLGKDKVSSLFRGKVEYKHKPISGLGDLKPRSFLYRNGALWLGLGEKGRDVAYYILVPRLRSGFDHSSLSHPSVGELVNLWLKREPVPKKGFTKLIEYVASEDQDVRDLSRGVLKFMSKFTSNKLRIKLRERMEAAETQLEMEKTTDELIQMMIGALLPQSIEDKERSEEEAREDALEAMTDNLVEDMGTWDVSVASGLRVFSLESFQSTFMTNPTSRTLARELEKLLDMEDELLSEKAQSFINFYRSLSLE